MWMIYWLIFRGHWRKLNLIGIKMGLSRKSEKKGEKQAR